MRALYVMVSGRTPLPRIWANISSARSHCPPFAHALMRALYVTWCRDARPPCASQRAPPASAPFFLPCR
eukprot:1688873-Pyramimonas_sp.AAC.1